MDGFDLLERRAMVGRGSALGENLAGRKWSDTLQQVPNFRLTRHPPRIVDTAAPRSVDPARLRAIYFFDCSFQKIWIGLSHMLFAQTFEAK